MQPISNIHSNHTAAAQQAETAAKLPAPEQPEQSKEGPAPAAQFLHEEPESPGRYWIERSDQGVAVRFDPPTQPETADAAGSTESSRAAEPPAESTKQPKPPAPEHDEPSGEPEEPEGMRCSTDRVDKEIQAVRARAAALAQQLSAAKDDAERADIQRELDAANRELAQKDNDAYRRQHAQFTAL